MRRGLLWLGVIALTLAAARLAFPAPAAGARTARLARVAQLRRQAIAAVHSGDHERAIELYRAWAELQPRNPLVLKDLMWELWGRGRFAEAAETARLVLALRPADRYARRVLERMPEAAGRARVADVSLELSRQAQAGASREELAPVYREGVAAAARLAELRPRDPRAWNALGRMQAGLGQRDAALESYGNSLALRPEQPSVTLAVARLRFDDRDFDEAGRLLGGLASSGTLPSSGYPLLGKALFWTKRYEEALACWDKAAELFPESLDYRFHRAWTLWRAGRQEPALRLMGGLYDEHGYERAFNFLLDNALRLGDDAGAVAMLQARLAGMTPADGDRVTLLDGLYEKTLRPGASEKLMDRYLELRPGDQNAWLRKADLALSRRDLKAARSLALAALPLNPDNRDVHGLLAGIAETAGEPREALRRAARALALDPTDPSGILDYARGLREAGRRREARGLLEGWLDRNRSSAVLPILLYHGLAASPDDPLLAYSYHHRADVFADHMRALRDGGFTPVAASEVDAWLRGKAELPERPVWITFDDGRLDSFQEGDPALEKYGMKATMFVTLANTEASNPPGYASWSLLRRYRESGRWELQSHGGLAHARIPSGPAGVRGLFLINRLWRAESGTLESVEDWESRIEADHRYSVESHLRHAGARPVAYAFPQSNFGQTADNGNVREAAAVNLGLVGKYFRLACVQDRFGMNTRDRDPLRLRRLEPGSAWSGDELLRYLRDNSPAVRMRGRLLRWAVEDGRLHEALRLLEEQRRAGVSEARLLDGQSHIRLAAGDISGGKLLARRSALLETLPETRRRVESLVAQEGLAWVPGYVYERDNQGRRNWLFEQTLDVLRTGPVKWSLRHQRGEYLQDGAAAVVDDAGGGAVEAVLGLHHTLSGEALFHALSGPARDTYALRGGLESRWRDDLQTRLEAGRSIYGSAEALGRDIASAYGDALGRWSQRDGPWRAELRGRFGRLSDGNRRAEANLELARALLPSGLLRGVYRLAFDDMREERTAYYSPRKVRANALGLELDARSRERLRLSVRYLPAYVQESGAEDGISHSVAAELSWRPWERLTLRPSYQYYATPSYRDHRAGMTLSWRFENARF